MERREERPASGGVRYFAEACTYHAPETGAYLGYDLVAVDGESGEVLARVADVTVDRALAETMAVRFERCGLSPVHLKDAVLDLLP